MKTIRKFSKNPVLVVFLISCMLFVSCGKDQVATPNSFSGKEIMSAVFFADGPVIDVLPEVKNAVDIKLFIEDPSELGEVRNLYGQLLDELDRRNPGAFNDFRAKMRSGDHVVIQETISTYGTKISEIIKTELKNIIDYSKLEKNNTKVIQVIKKYENMPTGQNSVKQLVENEGFKSEIKSIYDDVKEQSLSGRISTTENASCIWFAAAVVWFAALAAWVYIWWAVLAWTFFWSWNELYWGDIIWAEARSSNGNLLKDQVINSIAVNLAAN